ncbi:MAG: PQQ-binding-like beta-propeller repeat protein [Pirellulales bacterium]|nr:PQQ-binding-like beta-propeller repeat protein [Pirellulales bacterium]
MPCPTLPVVIGRSLPLLICLVTCGALAATANEPSGPIIDWNLQKRSTSIGRSHSELQRAASAPLRFDPQPPHALRFSASQEALRTTSLAAPLPQNALSVQLWVRPEANQQSFGFICCQKSGQIGWLLGGDRDHFFFALHCKNKKGPTQLTARPFYQNAQWYQITATYDGQQQKIYVDGTLAGEAFEQRGSLLPLDSPEIEIGVLPSRNENQKGPTFFSGQIGAIRVWNRVLSASEIKAQFAAEHASYPGALAEYDASRDWPTFGHDNHRSRRAGSEPDLPLHLAWSRKIRPGPRPAWPPPARQDFWNRKENLKPRVAFDRCFEPVVADGKVYLGSSSEDQLYCFDLASGEELWSFFAEAPIRLAPTVVDGRVLFGSDDGGVYCLDADSGEEIWRYKPAGDYFPGNGRLVHPQLVRSGIFVEAGKVWFTAGLFPRQGVYLVAIDLRDGTLLKKTDLSRSPQGYLRRLGGRLFAPTGRNLRGAVLQSLDGKTKDPVIQRPQLLAPFDRTAIAAGSLVFAGGPGTVAAFSRDKNQKLWEENIEGTCGSLILADDHLIVSTEEGNLYCFTPQKHESSGESSFSEPAGQKSFSESRTVNAILETTGLRQGYCLLLGDDLAEEAIQIALTTEMQVILGMQDAVKIEQERNRLNRMNLYGQVSIHNLADKKTLPYGNWLFNLVVVADAEKTNLNFDREEIWRVVRPSGGCLWDLKQIHPTYRDSLEGAGQWTHLYGNVGNTACSDDRLVRGQLAPQWFGLPGPQGMIDRHHRTAAPLCRDGTLYVPGNETIYAVDAYNGTVLWETAVPGSRRIGVLRDCGSMCAAEDGLFVASGDTCSLLARRDGQFAKRLKVPQSEKFSSREWGLVACSERLLFGSGVPTGGIRRGHSRVSILEGTHWDFRPIVTSESVFAFDQDSQKLKWQYAPADRLVLNPTIALGGDRMYFVEIARPKRKQNPGRVQLDEALDHGVRVVALDQQTGSLLWQQEADYAAIEHHLFGFYAGGSYITVGSRNQAGSNKKATVWYDIHALDAGSGKTKWQATQDNQTAAGGDHGEQDHHPVIVGDRLYVEPFAYDLKTGERDFDWGWQRGHRGGCGTIAASNSAFFFRDSHAAMFDLASQKHSKVTQVSRPGCWINMIPAGGLLLIPEASSGCTCHFAVQASMAFRPKEHRDSAFKATDPKDRVLDDTGSP